MRRERGGEGTDPRPRGLRLNEGKRECCPPQLGETRERGHECRGRGSREERRGRPASGHGALLPEPARAHGAKTHRGGCRADANSRGGTGRQGAYRLALVAGHRLFVPLDDVVQRHVLEHEGGAGDRGVGRSPHTQRSPLSPFQKRGQKKVNVRTILGASATPTAKPGVAIYGQRMTRAFRRTQRVSGPFCRDKKNRERGRNFLDD